MSRLDLNAVLDWVPEGSTVLDLGCGDGAFLQRLRNERSVTGVGVDIDAGNLLTAVSKGLDVIQEDINDGLHCFTCLLYTSPSPRDQRGSRMPSSA